MFQSSIGATTVYFYPRMLPHFQSSHHLSAKSTHTLTAVIDYPAEGYSFPQTFV